VLVGRNGSTALEVPGSCRRYICIVGGKPSGGVDMLALLTWFASGRPFGGVRTVHGVQQDRVAAVALEVAIAGVEADRRASEPVMEAVGEVEGVGHVRLLVAPPREAGLGVPRAHVDVGARPGW
jgi:hypothetical protein